MHGSRIEYSSSSGGNDPRVDSVGSRNWILSERDILRGFDWSRW